MFNKEKKMVSVSLTNLVTIKGYEPNGKDKMYIISVEGKLETQKVIGHDDKAPIRSLLCIAEVTGADDRAVVGTHVILADKKFVGMAKSCFQRKQALALVHMLNVSVKGGEKVSIKSNLSDNVEEVGTETNVIRLDAARVYGYKPMKKAVEKQNGMILNSMKGSATALRKADAKLEKSAAKAAVAEVASEVEEVVAEVVEAVPAQ